MVDIDALAARLARELAGPSLRAYLPEDGDPLTVCLRALLDKARLLGPPGCGNAVLPRLCRETVCQVWAGVCLTAESRLLYDTLKAGGRVWTVTEGLEPGPWRGETVRRLDGLVENGLTICPAGELVEWMAHGTTAAGLVTARRLGDAFHQGICRIYLACGALVTPLARDFAAEHHMILRRERGNDLGPGGGFGVGGSEER